MATYAAVYVVRSPETAAVVVPNGSEWFRSVKRRELPGQHTFAALQMGSTWLRDLHSSDSEVWETVISCDIPKFTWCEWCEYLV